MSNVKVGDRVVIGPFEVEQFRPTHNPGPTDSGETVIVSRPGGAMGADSSLVLPWHPALPILARWLSEDDENIDELIATIQWDLEWAFPNKRIEAVMQSLLVALESGR